MAVFYKYQGAGNDFLIADNRDGHIRVRDGKLDVAVVSGVETYSISLLCDRRYGIGADGLMLLEGSDKYDFRMTYFNSDGSGGMMCGNGGRCIVAFAADRGIGKFEFEAADGYHVAEIIRDEGQLKLVRLKMKDVTEIVHFDSLTGVEVPSEGVFLDTGTRHYVRFVEDADMCDVVGDGRDIRFNASELLPVGVNVNFVEATEGFIKVRTYEKGVEDETFACGTGIVASCVAAWNAGVPPQRRDDGMVGYDVMAKRDRLSVDFRPASPAEDVWLTGPAVRVAEIRL